MRDKCMLCGTVVLEDMWHVTFSDGVSKAHGECVQEYGYRMRVAKAKGKPKPRLIPDDGEPTMIRERVN